VQEFGMKLAVQLPVSFQLGQIIVISDRAVSESGELRFKRRNPGFGRVHSRISNQ
jgi:hypothetical protein